MICYKDTTFCVNRNCKNKCRKFLTPEIEQTAKHFKMHLAVTEYICLDKEKMEYIDMKQRKLNVKEMPEM